MSESAEGEDVLGAVFGEEDQAYVCDPEAQAEAEAEAASAPAVACAGTQRAYSPPTLRQICVDALSQCRELLGDIGYVDPESVRDILSLCSVQQLSEIEDATLKGSQRDLSWYTWPIWQRLYSQRFSTAPQKVPPLRTPQPEDYVPPKGISAPEGDWRACLLKRQREEADRAARLRGKLQAAYQEDSQLKKRTAATTKLPPPKRSRGASVAHHPRLASGPIHAPNSSLLSQPQGQAKLLQGLGLLNTSRTTFNHRANATTSTSASLKAGVKVVVKRTTYLAPHQQEQRQQQLQQRQQLQQQQQRSASHHVPGTAGMRAEGCSQRQQHPHKQQQQPISEAKAAAIAALQSAKDRDKQLCCPPASSKGAEGTSMASRGSKRPGGDESSKIPSKHLASTKASSPAGASSPGMRVSQLPTKPTLPPGQRLGLSGYAKLQGSNGYVAQTPPPPASGGLAAMAAAAAAGKGGQVARQKPVKLLSMDDLLG